MREIGTRNDWLTTLAGTDEDGMPVTKAPAAGADLHRVCGVTVDHHGNVLFSSTIGEVLVIAHTNGWFYQRQMTAGDLYLVAGKDGHGFNGNGGPARSAKLLFPEDVAVDAAGNLVIADTANSRIRVVAVTTGTFYGQAMTAGDIYTIAGDGGSIYSGNGGPATKATLLLPGGVAVDSAGDVLIADSWDELIREISAS